MVPSLHCHNMIISISLSNFSHYSEGTGARCQKTTATKTIQVAKLIHKNLTQLMSPMGGKNPVRWLWSVPQLCDCNNCEFESSEEVDMRMHTLGSPEVGSVTEKVTLGSCGGESGSPLSPPVPPVWAPPVPPWKVGPPCLVTGPQAGTQGGPGCGWLWFWHCWKQLHLHINHHGKWNLISFLVIKFLLIFI